MRRNGGQMVVMDRMFMNTSGVGSQKPEIEQDGSVLGYIRPLIDAGRFCEVKYPPAVVI